MKNSTIDQLIISSPYEEPKHYWSYDRESDYAGASDDRSLAIDFGNVKTYSKVVV